MSQRTIIPAILGLCAYIAGYSPVHSQEFVFNVPVNVQISSSRIEQRYYAGVRCLALRRDDGTSLDNRRIAYGSQFRELSSSRSFNGTILVPAYVDPSRSPNDAQNWRCELDVYLGNTGEFALEVAGNSPWVRRASDAVVDVVATGNFYD